MKINSENSIQKFIHFVVRNEPDEKFKPDQLILKNAAIK